MVLLRLAEEFAPSAIETLKAMVPAPLVAITPSADDGPLNLMVPANVSAVMPVALVIDPASVNVDAPVLLRAKDPPTEMSSAIVSPPVPPLVIVRAPLPPTTALIVCSVGTVLVVEIVPPKSTLNWSPLPRAPRLYAATSTVSNDMLPIGCGPPPKSMLMLPFPAPLKVAVLPLMGTAFVSQLVWSAQRLFAVPTHVCARTFELTVTSATTATARTP